MTVLYLLITAGSCDDLFYRALTLWLVQYDTVYQRLSFSFFTTTSALSQNTSALVKPFDMAESSSLIVQMDVDEAAIDEGLYSRQL